MKEYYFNQLNKQQLEAVKHYKGPCMVYAGPGSGKTTVITHRVGYLINYYNIDPNKILVISFTKSSAEEMKSRFQHIYGQSLFRRKSVNFGTFHSTFFKILRAYSRYDLSSILNEGDKYSIIKNIVKTLSIGNELEEEFIKDIILDISLFKSNILDIESFTPNSMRNEDFHRVLSSYENYKSDCCKIDFDDMLTKCYELLINQPEILQKIRNTYQYILIDEFQDINSIQFEIIKLLTGSDENLFVVGDDDQSIYSFRGANPNFILEFDKIYKNTKKIILNLNYRSQENIINIANRVINNNNLRIKKSILATKEPGVDIQLFRPKNREMENQEINYLINNLIEEGYHYKDIAIIYRTNILASAIVDSFLDNNIPFNSREQIYNIYEHWVAKDLISYLKSALDINDSKSLKRIINRPTRYITNKAIREAEDYHKDIITSLRVKGNLMPYQRTYLDKLEVDLKTIYHLQVKDAVNYIRKDIGYDDYIHNYCLEKQINSSGLIEILDELEDISSKYDCISRFVKHVAQFKESLYSNKKHYSSSENHIELLTMHSAKGLEFKVVIIIDAVEDIIPHNKSQDEKSIEEERRLFYVAITRAKERLYIYAPLHRYDKRTQVSRFVSEAELLNINKSKLKKGQKIIHRIFGKGIIEDVNQNMIKVRFYKNNEIKDLDINTCIENNLIN